MNTKYFILAFALSCVLNGFAADSLSREAVSNQRVNLPNSEENGKDDSNLAGDDRSVRTTNPRWYKEKSSRQEYLEGSNDFMQKPGYNGSSEELEKSPRSDSRWVKNPAARQQYLKGGSDHPSNQK